MKNLFFFFMVLLSSVSFSQEKETEKLIAETSKIVFSKPSEAVKVSEHILKTNLNQTIQAKANLLLATSYYVKGRYDSCLIYSYKTRDISNSINNEYANAILIIADVLSKLDLKKEADQYIQQINFNIPDIKKYRKPIEESYKPQPKIDKSIENLLCETSNLNLDYGIKITLKNLGLKLLDSYIEQENLNNAKIWANKIEADSFENYWKSLYLLKSSEIDFVLNKNNKEAVQKLNQVNTLNEQLQNPYIDEELHRNLSSNYLVLNDYNKFHEFNQKAYTLSNTIEKIENNSTSTAHQLINNENDRQVLELEKKHKRWLILLLSILALSLILKTFLFYKNKNKLKTYKLLGEYLAKEENQKIEAKIISQKPTTNPLGILKESEIQILRGLEKFENSKKFNNKDMSLNMLATLLNTNTKYLSQIIKNRHQKNFKSYINELRINYIINKIKENPSYLNYKVSYLAEECGFSSHSTFTTVFRSILGISPIEFIEIIKEESQKESSQE